jgi:hypothetical protein
MSTIFRKAGSLGLDRRADGRLQSFRNTAADCKKPGQLDSGRPS